jgi:hypothetical protein
MIKRRDRGDRRAESGDSSRYQSRGAGRRLPAAGNTGLIAA